MLLASVFFLTKDYTKNGPSVCLSSKSASVYLILTSIKIATEADLNILCNTTNLECVLKERLRVVKGQLINRSRDCQFLTAFLLPITVF